MRALSNEWGDMVGQPTDRTPIRPRVIHVTTAHRADDVRIFERECRSLAASGRYDVFLAAAGTIPAGSGVSLVPLKPAPPSRSGRFAAGPRRALGLSRAMSAKLWHFHDPELLPVAIRLAVGGQSVVWDAHEDYTAQFVEGGGKSWVPGPARRVVRLGMRAMLEGIDARAAAVVAATPTIASKYRNPRTVVVGNEARVDLFAACVPDARSRRVLFTGHVGPGHLFQEVVEAVALIPDVVLVVAGREPQASQWGLASSRLGERLQHVGWLDREGLAAVINSVSLGLSTYADIPTNSNNSPNKLFEFCAAGLPVVATPNQSNVRYLSEGGGGFVADGFTAEAIARSIEHGLADLDDWTSASARGRVWAMRAGSWEGSEGRLLELYQQILGV